MKRLVALGAGVLWLAPSLASAQDAPPPEPADPARTPAPAPAPEAAAAPAPAAAPAAPAGTHDGHKHDGHEARACDVCSSKWASVSLSPGLQMWRSVVTDDAGVIDQPNVIGLVLKAQLALTDMIAVHARGAYGWNSVASPTLDREVKVWMAGIGFDMYFALGKHVVWYNTMGLGFEQAMLHQMGRDQPKMSNPGAYFVTTLDITMFGNVGMWMDWGCGVVGPAFATTPAGDVKTWHINPLGAGGFRFSF